MTRAEALVCRTALKRARYHGVDVVGRGRQGCGVRVVQGGVSAVYWRAEDIRALLVRAFSAASFLTGRP